MIEAYRISKESDPAKAFSGQGAKDWGGRWNSRGVAVVYTAAHRSLAILEILVHMKGGAGSGKGAISTPFLVYAVSFDEALLEALPITSLAPGWNSEPPTTASQTLGNTWVMGGRSAVLAVPSVIVPEERNFVLNPSHPRFSDILVSAPVSCPVDPRLL